MRCPGCGVNVVIPEHEGEDDTPKLTRDGMLTATPGRATITVSGEIVHRCAPGRFLPPDRSA
jgi:hypothetical protein